MMVTCHTCNVAVGKATVTCKTTVPCHNCKNPMKASLQFSHKYQR